ncbi:hypothetical protein DKX38_011270 [Salix brachista]|uniref:DYW domain-containing protein n=1 Tax=Salix brachista TaxID=2182728 RepID=A0A5N5LY98_9ROSI|nr:hypothetical protein DKX38_011270 [Salix brachista]
MPTTTIFTTPPPPLPHSNATCSSTTLHNRPPEKIAILIDKSKSLNHLNQVHAFLYRHNLHDHPILNFKLQRSYSSLELYVRTCLAGAYARGGDVVSARKLFDAMPEKSLVSLTAMITCYAKNGMIDEARVLFDGIEERDVICWNVMIDGYAQHGLPNEGLLLFRQMLNAKVRPNEVTVLAVLSACGQIGALETGRWVHSYIENNGIGITVSVGTSLIDMYSKCGSLEDARLIFERISNKDVVAWNSMVFGYAMHGFSQDALRLFKDMCMIGYHPTDITFIGVLNACGHAGLVSEGWKFFFSMKDEYGIEPKVEHYGCMVNLLGRAGQLEEAYELVKNMDIEQDPVLWGTLLGACRLHGNIALGERIAEYLVSQNLANSGTYVLLSNIYAAAGNWEGVARVRTLMKESGVEKEPGCSSVEVNNKVHEFLAGDLRHPKSKEIYEMLEEINGWLKTHGHTPQTDIVLHDLEDAQKERSLGVHSEKLALAFGLITTKPGTTMKIVKNLRVCEDCHAVTKLISKITGRKIVMRDRNRFHHFVNGSCSCGDYWPSSRRFNVLEYFHIGKCCITYISLYHIEVWFSLTFELEMEVKTQSHSNWEYISVSVAALHFFDFLDLFFIQFASDTSSSFFYD